MKGIEGTPVRPGHELSRVGIEAIERLIRPHIRGTPVVEVAGAEFGLGSVRLFFKLEGLQRGGSFKTRGAFANLLAREVPPAGVVAASGGNHGIAVALAADALGRPARIFVPRIASPAKLERIRGTSAELVVIGERYADALAASEEWAVRSGAMPVHAFDQVETLLGQGSVGLELERQAPQLDTLLVPVGGGGLIGALAAWYHGAVRLVGVEPEAAPTLAEALRAGRPVDVPIGGIAADSLGTTRAGTLMFPLAQAHVDRVVLVPDDAIRAAQEALWRTLRIVAEPGGAASFAALLSGRYQAIEGERIGLIVSGANSDAVDFDLASAGTVRAPRHVDRAGAEHYVWGERCDGWRLLADPRLSVIEEKMPARTSETAHHHRASRQFFYVLSGEAKMALEGGDVTIRAGEGLEVPPGVRHQLFNRSPHAIRFLVISSPSSHRDRFPSHAELL